MKKLLIGFFVLINISWVSAQNSITFYPDSAKHQISRHIYGHFAEHLGRLIYDGIYVDDSLDVETTNGLRNDIIAALKEIGIPNLRWPGGCFADTYNWRDGIGPKEDRPTIINTHWGGIVENNSFGTHEFLELCKLLDCEPVICGNVGSGTVREMSQWVEYLNFEGESPMANLRKENGHEDAFNVKYFGIGNENWGCGGNMSAEYYRDKMTNFSTYAKDYGSNKLYRVAGGPNSGDYHWMETLMSSARSRNSFQGVSVHHYTIEGDRWEDKGSATEYDERSWQKYMINAWRMDELVTKHSAIMDKYDPEKSKGLIIDEWGNWHLPEPGSNPGFLYQHNTLRDAVTASINFNVFNNHADRVKMANIAQVVNVLQALILTKEEEMLLTPTYYVFKMYKVHHDAMLIPSEVKGETYGEGDRTMNAIQTSCSKARDGKIHVTLSNVDPNKELEVECGFEGLGKVKALKGEIITGEKITSLNDFGQEEQVNIQEFNSFKATGNKLTVKMPSKSVVMIELEVE
ncbi:alpha-L-arabinofuranosidase C-terminal domain-containing protein [Flammeovirgaceae bacterium SG7u.111]|nr:alpha-L-arabinofuranosidase C-terminal domain-containing protein [Flammeovirgaceae bacterium SG7u.132]WPO34338.1 alpha-L-arabinofuranosidase C-terminal domain-containing protein [Flammeovirgaceae bacterium SG7u.111]